MFGRSNKNAATYYDTAAMQSEDAAELIVGTAVIAGTIITLGVAAAIGIVKLLRH